MKLGLSSRSFPGTTNLSDSYFLVKKLAAMVAKYATLDTHYTREIHRACWNCVSLVNGKLFLKTKAGGPLYIFSNNHKRLR
jgi:hypothetical protein